MPVRPTIFCAGCKSGGGSEWYHWPCYVASHTFGKRELKCDSHSRIKNQGVGATAIDVTRLVPEEEVARGVGGDGGGGCSG